MLARMKHAAAAGVLALPWAIFAAATEARAQLPEELVHSYLWPQSAAEFGQAQADLASHPSLDGVTRTQVEELSEIMRRGPPVSDGEVRGLVGDAVLQLSVSAPGERVFPVFVRLPSGYTPDRQWPLMLAMHGGPPGSEEGAVRSALGMIDVWAQAAEDAGWIVASPAMVSVVAREGRTPDRLPYEVFHAEEARAVVDAVRTLFKVSTDRIVSTGISLGSNFSIAFAAAHPDWLSAIVPVSTEGESREHLLRNLAQVPTYVLEGSLDPNIRSVAGPRAMSDILSAFGYDLLYREFGDRAHEGFREHYPDVLRWLEARARGVAPTEVLRVPHRGIMPLSRRTHWVETDTRQGVVRARATSATRIDVEARWAGEVTLFLSDELVDLDRPITVHVNGSPAFAGRVSRSLRVVLEEARLLGDERRVYATRLTVPVPTTGASVSAGALLTTELAPSHPEGQLSFWEMYAVRALEERFPNVGFGGVEVALPVSVSPRAPEQVALRVTEVEAGSAAGAAGLRAGDLLISVGDEPSFRGKGGVRSLHHWMVRELRETPAAYALRVWRDGRPHELTAMYALGPYRPPAPGEPR